MKGTIKENLGTSRYIVGVKINVEPVTGIRDDLNQQYDDISQKLIEAYGKLAEAQAPYEAILAEIETASLAYQACINTFNLSACIDAKLAACEDAYNDCELECSKIESAPGECDLDCQQARDACKAACQRQRDACRAVAEIECQETYQAALSACQAEWSPYITNLQSSALDLLGAVREAQGLVGQLEAQQLSLARRINELDGVAAQEEQVTCFRAQYKDDIAAGTEVEVARTPAGRTVITEIAAPGVCLQDSRALPSGHLFVNAATYPGWETWRPTWRTGTVKKVLAEQNKLKVEVKSGTLPGNLGTIHSRDPIDCTPPQAYFDGNWQTAEQRIKDAREALTAAQTALQDAAKVRDECIAQYDTTWQNACYTDKAAICAVDWANWLDLCNESELPDCLEQYQAGLAACYAQAQAECISERDNLIAQCRADYQPAVDDAQAVVDAAGYAMTQELIGTYQPANPLIIDLPVFHCTASNYAVDDDVLIDFPVRSGGADEPMAVWESARVIGWAAETITCCCGINTTFNLKRTTFPQILDENEDGVADDNEYWGYGYDDEDGNDVPLAPGSVRCDGDFLLIDINDSLAIKRYFYLFPLLQDATPLEITLGWEASGEAEIWLIYINESQPGAEEQNLKVTGAGTYCLLIGTTDVKVILGAGANIKLWLKIKGHTLPYCEKPVMSMEAYNALWEDLYQQAAEANAAVQAAQSALSSCPSEAYATLEACCVAHAADYLMETYNSGTSEEELNQIVYINGLPVTLRSIYTDAISQCEGGNFGCYSEYSDYLGVVNTCNEGFGPAVDAALAQATAIADLIRETLYKAKPC